MKKLIAFLLAVSMTFAFAGCSDNSSSAAEKTASSSSSSIDDTSITDSGAEDSSNADQSKTEGSNTDSSNNEQETTTQATTSAAEQNTSSEKETAKQGGSGIKFEDSYTYKFQQQSASKAFAMNMSMNYYGIEMPIEFQKNGDDFHLKMTAASGQVSVVNDYYVIAGKTYILDAAKKSYSEYAGASANVAGVTNLVPEGTFEVLSSKEENGQIVEAIRINQTSTDTTGANKVTSVDATYYFDKATGEPRKIDVNTSGVKTSVSVTKFQVGPQTIKLPDLTGWTKKDNSAATTTKAT